MKTRHPNSKPAAQRATGTLNIRVKPADLRAWSRAARKTGATRSAWIVTTLNCAAAE